VPSREDEKQLPKYFDEFGLSKIDLLDKAQPVPGYLAFESNSGQIGLIVYRKGVPYVANNRLLQKILFHKDLEPKRLADLQNVPQIASKSKKQLFHTDIQFERKYSGQKTNFYLKLNYVQRNNQDLSFYFSFTPQTYNG